jgi:hypothetical protein
MLPHAPLQSLPFAIDATILLKGGKRDRVDGIGIARTIRPDQHRARWPEALSRRQPETS